MSTDRPYSSSLREEQALQTRLRVRRAARELFAAQGFASTTIAQIARSAGVSAATVYAAFESKAGIVVAMLEELEEDVGIGPQLESVFAELDPGTQLREYVAVHCHLFAEGSDILRAAMRAVEDSDVAALVEAGDNHRRQAIDALVARWQVAGALRSGLTRRQASDRLWLLTTVEGFLNAVHRLGWTHRQYETWLVELAQREMLDSSR